MAITWHQCWSVSILKSPAEPIRRSRPARAWGWGHIWMKPTSSTRPGSWSPKWSMRRGGATMNGFLRKAPNTHATPTTSRGCCRRRRWFLFTATRGTRSDRSWWRAGRGGRTGRRTGPRVRSASGGRRSRDCCGPAVTCRPGGCWKFATRICATTRDRCWDGCGSLWTCRSMPPNWTRPARRMRGPRRRPRPRSHCGASTAGGSVPSFGNRMASSAGREADADGRACHESSGRSSGGTPTESPTGSGIRRSSPAGYGTMPPPSGGRRRCRERPCRHRCR